MNLLSCIFQVCDEPEELKRKATELAAVVRNAKHLVIYTGAGISTVGFFGGEWPELWEVLQEHCSVVWNFFVVSK